MAEQSLQGDLVTVLRELDALVKSLVEERPAADSILREKSRANYPVIALRELLINALLHRAYQATAPVRFYWYADHVEIQSPGGLYGEASPENFPRQNSYRNPVLAEALKTLGYVNKFGRGVFRAQAALESNGNRPADFRFDPSFVSVTLWAAQ